MKCPNDQVYASCVPVNYATCTADEVKPTQLQPYCEEGCVCSAGKVLHNDQCIDKTECPCIYGGKYYTSNSTAPKDCNEWYVYKHLTIG